MNIVLTGSIGNIGKPLTESLVQMGHTVTVISSSAERQQAIESLGAQAAIGSMLDAAFLADTFKGADIVYLMETMDAAGGDTADADADFMEVISRIGHNYRQAVTAAGIKRVVHLSSIGAHMDQGNGILRFHYNVEQILAQLPADVAIKTLRPAGFYTNMFGFMHTIRQQGAIVSNYGGDRKEPWVSPLDIAAVIAEEMEQPFEGRTIRYIASDEVSPNEIARTLGAAIAQPDLQWQVIPDGQLYDSWVAAGFNPKVAQGFIEMQQSQRDGRLYEDYYRHPPVLGKVKLDAFAAVFAKAYGQE